MINDIIGIISLILAFVLTNDAVRYWRMARLILGKKAVTYRDLVSALVPAMLCLLGALLVATR